MRGPHHATLKIKLEIHTILIDWKIFSLHIDLTEWMESIHSSIFLSPSWSVFREIPSLKLLQSFYIHSSLQGISHSWETVVGILVGKPAMQVVFPFLLMSLLFKYRQRK